MLTLRSATLEDAPALWGIMSDYQHYFLDDYSVLNKQTVISLLETGCVYCIDAFDYPVGMVWFNDQFYDLHISIHLLIRPKFMKLFSKENMGETIVDFGFNTYNVKKIKAFVLETQTVAIKLVLKHGFKQRAFYPRDTRQNGRYTHVRVLELAKHDWRYFKKHPDKRKK